MHQEIKECLNVLYSANQMIYDYWMWTLYDMNDEPIESEWNQENLKLIQNDVKIQTTCNE